MPVPDDLDAAAAGPLEAGSADAFRRGDRTAFFAVYEAYGADVRGVVARYFRSPFEREEAVQEIWLNVHQAASQFDPARGRLRPWLRTVAVNRCLQILRAQGRRPRATEEADEADLVAPDTPLTAARNARLRAALEAFAATLPPDELGVFRLAFAEGGAQEEVAEGLGISVRRYKYLRKKILLKAESAPELARVLEEILA